MATPPMSIYAELLSNIRQISLAVTLPSPADPSTRITITQDASASAVHVDHAGAASSLTLPGRVLLAHGQDLPIQRRSADGETLTWRLPLVNDSQRPEAAGTAVPWEARDLKPGSPVSCRGCRAIVLREGAVKEWKDLPAEGWAEMMEFWHCHKPGEEHHHGHGHGHRHGHDHQASGGEDVLTGEGKADEATLASRGYGAASTISAQKGVGFVDLTTFLFADGDVQGVTFSPSAPTAGSASLASLPSTTSSSNLNIFCTTCHTRIGYFNNTTSAVTLFKWSLSLPTSSRTLHLPPAVSHCLSSTLQATLSRTNSSKSLLLPINRLPSPSPSPHPQMPVLHFWILNPSLKYTSSRSGGGAVKAMKLLYRTVTSEDADRMLDDVNSDVQEVNLPEEAIGEVMDRLRESNAVLPATERRLREWDVAMLGLWEGE